MSVNPYIKPRFNTATVIMLDVIIALLPLVGAAYIAYGMQAVMVILSSVGAALITDFVFSALFLKKYTAVLDGSAVITALLLSFTLSPITPLPVVAFGSGCAILFGKIAWGGLGKNRFNPALVGREFMVAFFPAIMGSATIWATKAYINTPATDLFPGLANPYLSGYLSGLVYKTNGALGEYSIALIALGGLYLLFRKRISWHIPFALLSVFIAAFWLTDDGDDLKYSMGGVLLGALFMATDMPSSPTNSNGKLYYGGMIGLVAFLFILCGVGFEYMSYSILILNGFSYYISEAFRPRAWAETTDFRKRTEQVFSLTMAILGVALAVVSLHYYHKVHYLVYLYILYIIFKFNFSYHKKSANPI